MTGRWPEPPEYALPQVKGVTGTESRCARAACQQQLFFVKVRIWNNGALPRDYCSKCARKILQANRHLRHEKAKVVAPCECDICSCLGDGACKREPEEIIG